MGKCKQTVAAEEETGRSKEACSAEGGSGLRHDQQRPEGSLQRPLLGVLCKAGRAAGRNQSRHSSHSAAPGGGPDGNGPQRAPNPTQPTWGPATAERHAQPHVPTLRSIWILRAAGRSRLHRHRRWHAARHTGALARLSHRAMLALLQGQEAQRPARGVHCVASAAGCAAGAHVATPAGIEAVYSMP